jgi:regulator of nucleoside diphosphate kinase
MQDPIIVTVNDYQRLLGLIELASLKTQMPELTNQFTRHLNTARVLTQKDIAKNVVTMNSRVKLRALNSKREAEITVTYPHDAEPQERKISVFTEIGLALLGRRERDIVSWRVPNGSGLFEITKVTYQPEAAGDYYL